MLERFLSPKDRLLKICFFLCRCRGSTHNGCEKQTQRFRRLTHNGTVTYMLVATKNKNGESSRTHPSEFHSALFPLYKLECRCDPAENCLVFNPVRWGRFQAQPIDWFATGTKYKEYLQQVIATRKRSFGATKSPDRRRRYFEVRIGTTLLQRKCRTQPLFWSLPLHAVGFAPDRDLSS